MAFADLIDLRTAVIELVRNPSIADVFPRLVKLAEANFNRRLRCREMMTTDLVVPSQGVYPLPYDFQEVIGLFDASGKEWIAEGVQAFQGHKNRGFFAITGSDILTHSDEDLTLHYYALIPTLTASQTVPNWLLQKAPGLYLYAVGTEAAKYLRDVETATATAQMAEMEYQAVMAEAEAQRYSRARVRVQGVTP